MALCLWKNRILGIAGILYTAKGSLNALVVFHEAMGLTACFITLAIQGKGFWNAAFTRS